MTEQQKAFQAEIEQNIAELAQILGMDEKDVKQHLASTVLRSDRPLWQVVEDVLIFQRSIQTSK